MRESDIAWITEEPGDKALHAGVGAMIDCGLDGPDGVGPSDALAVWRATARTLAERFRAIQAVNEYDCASKDNRADCQWPMCGCDPYAHKVLVALQESGFAIVPQHFADGLNSALIEAKKPRPTP